MRRILTILALMLAACATPPAQEHGRAIEAGRSYTLQSAVMGEAREINVWLPPGYSESTDRYTVLYLIDGGVDQDFPHIAGLAALGALSWTYEQLIVVGVRTNVRRHELTPPPGDARLAAEFPEAGGAPRFRDFIAQEVIPWVEGRYRTGARRAIVGESLAGLFVVDTFLTQPALFHDYIAVSPSLWWDDQAIALAAPQRLAGRAAGETRLYLTIANEGEATQSGMNRLLAALEAAPQGSVTWRYVDRSASETHATIFHNATLDALRWLYALPEPDYGPTPWYYLNEADRPPS